jgi:hypothetical protein
MNEGGYLDGGFVQTLFDRNQAYEDMRRANAAAESYWRQLKMQQEMEREADLNKLGNAMTADMVPLSAEVDEYGHKKVKLGYAKDAKTAMPTVHSVPGGLGVMNPDGKLEWMQPPWDTTKEKPTSYQYHDGLIFDPSTGETRVDPNAPPRRTAVDADAVAGNRLAKEAAMADIRSTLSANSTATEQEKADARASLRLMAQMGRVGMIETTPADVTTTPESGSWWWKKPAQSVTNAPAMVTTNWYDQVLGAAPTNDVRAAAAPTNSPSAAAELTDVQAQRYLALRRSGKSKAEALQMVASGL